MRKWILIIVATFVSFQFVSAQDVVGCTQLLEDAKEAYSAGMVELVPELLLPCIESGLSGVPKQEAYKLVITAYLFDYLPDQADSLMKDFTDEFPDYQAVPSDPSEFVILLAAHQERMGVQPVEKKEQVQTEEPVKTKEKRQRTPRTTVVAPSRPGAGFILGTNLSFPQLIEPYGTADPLMIDGNYSVAAGLHLGGTVSLRLSRSVETAFDLLYQRARYTYTAVPYSFTSYEYEEVENRFGLPVSFVISLNPESRSQVYFRLGIVVDYLLSASASAVRSYTATGINQPDVVLEPMDITSSRARMNLYGMGGVGMKFRIQSGFIFVETRFQYGILKSNNDSKRYDNQDLTWLIYHVDNDFRLHHLSISAGMIFDLK
jgi:hypothetical protein